MGLLSLETNHHDLAVEWIASAIKRSPKAEYLSSLGAALQRQGRRDEALKALDKAVQLRPDDAALWTSLVVVLEELKRPSDAVLCFQHALKLDPRHLEAAYRSAVLLHQLGRLGKTILICSDKGLGDAIQFTRYVPMLAAHGARVVLVVQDSLQPLLSTLPGLSHCLSFSAATLPAVDVRCPVMSLPFAFRTTRDTIPPTIRLLPLVDCVRAWEERLGPHDRLRVGLTWSGSLTHPNVVI